MLRKDTPVRPFLKWAGGKRQLLTEIRKQLPPDADSRFYYEPFAGAGALFFELRPGKAVVNDSNTQLILTYRCVKEDVEGLIGLLETHEHKNSREYYYGIRNLDRDTERFRDLSDTEKAARLIFLNKTCFNGLYRVNSKGLFNVPYGRYKNPAICEAALLRRVSEYLNNNDIVFLNDDFETAVSGAGEDSFVYFDPPYHSPDKSNFTGYQSGGFGEADQERLRDLMLKMTDRGAKCLLSNSDTDYIRRLYDYDCFEIRSVQAKRLINSDSSRRDNAREVLIKNW
jgi:DNA adenine methylase